MTQQEGFSLIEVIISMLILSVAVLAMGASTGYIFAQVRGAELRTERTMAVQQAAERMRAMPWNTLSTECASLTMVQGEYTVTCEFSTGSGNLARLQLISEGPEYTMGGATRADTVIVPIARPL